MKLRPARSSGPSAGGTGGVPEQHEAYMMFEVPWSEWPIPMVCPISCSITREKFSDWWNDELRSAEFAQMT